MGSACTTTEAPPASLAAGQVDTPEKEGRRFAATGEQRAGEEGEGEEGGGAQALPALQELWLEAALALLAVGVAAVAAVPVAQWVTLPTEAVACGQPEECPGRHAAAEADAAARGRRAATSAANTSMPTQTWVREMALPHSTACARNGSL